jgi:hypothetical protein
MEIPEVPKNGNNLVGNNLKRYIKDAEVILSRVSFQCGFPKPDGSICEHMIGMFYRIGDTDVEILPNGNCVYKGNPLGWGNTIPGIDKKTHRKLCQTWRGHFVSKHGFSKNDDRLPMDCRMKVTLEAKKKGTSYGSD